MRRLLHTSLLCLFASAPSLAHEEHPPSWASGQMLADLSSQIALALLVAAVIVAVRIIGKRTTP